MNMKICLLGPYRPKRSQVQYADTQQRQHDTKSGLYRV